MFFLLSPAKSLNETHSYPASLAQQKFSQPKFLALSAQLIYQLKKFSLEDLANFMKISHGLAKLNHRRFNNWQVTNPAEQSYPAINLFNGDVYEGLAINTLNSEQALWVNQHSLILSGLYGLIKPFDLIQPYRLEMGCKFTPTLHKNLYHFWQTTITTYLTELIQQAKSKFLINLASREYSKAVDFTSLQIPVIDCVFKDYSNGEYKIISFYAKKARGLMLQHAARVQANSLEQLTQFDLAGYQYNAKNSSQTKLVFQRKLS